MFQLSDLVRPIIVAPMAGGVSTPVLVAAAADAGAMGFLAAGYTSVDALVGQIAATRGLGADLFGVNVFVPAPEPVDLAAARAYRDLLAGLAERYEVRLPEPRQDDDGWAAKIEALLDERVPVVSFAFGCPPAEVVRRFRGVGTATLATVTSALEAAQAAAAGVAGLVVQGPDGGGHRATFDALAEPGTTPLDEIVVGVRGVTGLPVVVAGGIAGASDVGSWLARAQGVQLGTAFLDADEAGTSPAYRAALHDPRFTETVLTRAFSGRWARGLRNAFVDTFTAAAPAAYPAVNQVTGVLRRAAGRAGDAENLSLWAGTGWRATRPGRVAAVVDSLPA